MAGEIVAHDDFDMIFTLKSMAEACCPPALFLESPAFIGRSIGGGDALPRTRQD